MFEKTKSKDFNWKTVEYVQATVKDSAGIGKQIVIDFFAPIDEENDKTASQEINYDYKYMDEELKLL